MNLLTKQKHKVVDPGSRKYSDASTLPRDSRGPDHKDCLPSDQGMPLGCLRRLNLRLLGSIKPGKASKESIGNGNAQKRKSSSPAPTNPNRESANSITVNPPSLASRSPSQSPTGTQKAGKEGHKYVLPDMMKDNRKASGDVQSQHYPSR